MSLRNVVVLFCLTALCAGATAQAPAPPAGFPTPTVSPVMPAEVNFVPGAGPDNNLPNFDDFSWREFIAATWPAAVSSGPPYQRGVANTSKAYGDVSVPAVFETWKPDYELFLPNGAAPAAWNSYGSPSPCGGALVPYQTLVASFDKYHGFNEAGFGVDFSPLVAQNRHYIRYDTRMNQAQYDFITNPPKPPYPGPLYLSNNLPPKSSTKLAFPMSSIELKVVWLDLTNVPAAQQKTFYTTKARLLDPVSGNCSAPTLVGLVGMHIVQKTKSFPNWVWSTFEHIDAVPAIAGESGQGTPPYDLNDNDPANQKLSAPSKPITKCNPPVPNPAPHQVVRIVAIASSTQTTNKLYRSDPRVSGTVWANYQLTLTQWQLDSGFPPGQPYFPNATDPKVPSNTANVAAETWFQAKTTTSCMACHQLAATKGNDFVWFLPLGSYPQPPDPCRALTAFVRAEKAKPPKGVAAAAAMNPAKAAAAEELRAIVGMTPQH